MPDPARSTRQAVPVRVVGRYAVYGAIGRGGMASVHFARLLGQVGFSRTVAVKMLQPQFAKDPAFVSMFMDEARLAARIVHPHVAQTIDVVSTQGELFVVMEYIHGESLARLMQNARESGERIPPSIAVAIVSGVLLGLHAAHEAKNARGEALDIVHRDVSPDNVLVGVDGIAKVADFGIAKARGRYQTTRTGELKGKLAYMAPEQLEGRTSRLTDVFATAIVLWEVLTGRRLFDGPTDAARIDNVRRLVIPPPRIHAPDIDDALERAVMRGLERDAARRFPTALDMATELQRATTQASTLDVAQWLERAAAPGLKRRAAQLAEIEHAPSSEQDEEDDDAEHELDDELTGPPTRAVPGLAHVANVADDSNGADSILADDSNAANDSNGADSNLADDSNAANDSNAADKKGRPSIRWWIAGLVIATFALAYYATSLRKPPSPALQAAPPTQQAATPPRSASPALSSSTPLAPPPPTDTPVDPPAPRAKIPARPTRPQTNCSPPYSIGADGLRHYKPECW